MRWLRRLKSIDRTQAALGALILIAALSNIAHCALIARDRWTTMPEQPFQPDVPPAKADKARGVNPTGVTGSEMPDVRQGAPLSREAVLVGLYELAARRINEETARAIAQLDDRRGAAFGAVRGQRLRERIIQATRSVDQEAARRIRVDTQSALSLGLKQAVAQIRALGGDSERRGVRAAGLELGQRATFDAFSGQAIERIAQDSFARLRAGLDDHAQRAEQVFRTMATASPIGGRDVEVNRAIAQSLISGDPRVAQREIREMFREPGAQESFRKLGNRQIEVGGWTGIIRQYASTVARTRTREATVAGRHQRLRESGIELVQITGRQSANFCTAFLGLVVSLGAATEEFPSIASLPSGGPPFHPNCSKGTSAYIPELVSSTRRFAAEKALPEFRARAAEGRLREDLTLIA